MRTFRSFLLLSLTLPGLLSLPPPEIEIVLARCHENTSWVDDLGYGDITTVYEKCGGAEGPGKHIPKPNVGREGGTYLQHIVDRYDSLADWTVFSQAGAPTYGYLGHRLPGGHMMRNVRFQDYVEAASRKATQPRFFIFTTILVMRDWSIFQSIRRGYGDDYSPDNEDPQTKMCGTMDDWSEWFEFPDWFKDMVIRLQEQQDAPFIHLKVEEVMRLFDFNPSNNMIFYPQGARFAISKEAIQTRPKSYYESLLPHFTARDPWAGYFLEWVWWYALGGSEAPCGFEAAAALGHYKWANMNKERIMAPQESFISGSQGADLIQMDSTTTINRPQTLRSAPGAQIRFPPGSTTAFNAPVTISGGGAIVVENGATVVFNAPVIFEVPVSFNGCTVTLAPGIVVTFIGGDVIVTNSQVLGTGTINFQQDPLSSTSSVISILDSTVEVMVELAGVENVKQQTQATHPTALLCGANQGAVKLHGRSTLELQTQCHVSDRPYSNIVSSLSATGVIVVTSVSSNSLPTLISSIYNPSATKLEVANIESVGFRNDILHYGSIGSCYDGWRAAIDGCQPGYSCSVYTSQTAGANQCVAVFSQSKALLQPLLGVLALLVPIIAVLAWYVGCYAGGKKEAKFSEATSVVIPALGLPTVDDIVKEPPCSSSSSTHPVSSPVFSTTYQMQTSKGFSPSSRVVSSPLEGDGIETLTMFDDALVRLAAPVGGASFSIEIPSPHTGVSSGSSPASQEKSASSRGSNPQSETSSDKLPDELHALSAVQSGAQSHSAPPPSKKSTTARRFTTLAITTTNEAWPADIIYEHPTTAMAKKDLAPQKVRQPPRAAFPRPNEDRWMPPSERSRYLSERKPSHLADQPAGTSLC